MGACFVLLRAAGGEPRSSAAASAALSTVAPSISTCDPRLACISFSICPAPVWRGASGAGAPAGMLSPGICGTAKCLVGTGDTKLVVFEAASGTGAELLERHSGGGCGCSLKRKSCSLSFGSHLSLCVSLCAQCWSAPACESRAGGSREYCACLSVLSLSDLDMPLHSWSAPAGASKAGGSREYCACPVCCPVFRPFPRSGAGGGCGVCVWPTGGLPFPPAFPPPCQRVPGGPSGPCWCGAAMEACSVCACRFPVGEEGAGVDGCPVA